MGVEIHPTAIVDSGARLGADVTVGPYAIIESNVEIDDGCRIDSHAIVASGARLGKRCHVFPYGVVGTLPQDLKFEGEETTLVVGDDVIVREFCTLNRGTKAAGKTVIGSRCAFLTGSHVGHDCMVGDHVILSNGTALGGHVEVGSHVTMSALVLVHQFVRVGDYAFIGPGCTAIQDVVPFALCGGERSRPRIAGINRVRLERQDFSPERRQRIKRAFRILFREGLTTDDALGKLTAEFPGDGDIELIASFVRNSSRGYYRMGES